MLVLDDEFVKAAEMPEEEIKLEFASWFFEKEKVSMRKAATLAGLHWLDFSKLLAARNIQQLECLRKSFKWKLIRSIIY